MQATDTTQSEDSELEMFFEPIETEDEVETEEAPQEETETEEAEIEDDAPAAEGDETGEDDDTSDEDEDEDASDDDEEEDGDEEEQPDESYTVKVDGEEITVTLDELKRGYSGQTYIQRGMETAKAQKRELDAQAQTLQQQSQVIAQLYQQSQQTGFTPAPQEPDPALAATDPFAYIEAEAEFKTQLRAYQSEQQNIQFLQQQQEAQNAANLRQHMQEQEKWLLEEMPELKDPKKAEAFKASLIKASDDYGYSKEELREIVKDRRSVKALADAQKWRDLQTSKNTAKQPRKEAKAVTRPKATARNSNKVTAKKIEQRVKATGNDAAVVDWLLTPE